MNHGSKRIRLECQQDTMVNMVCNQIIKHACNTYNYRETKRTPFAMGKALPETNKKPPQWLKTKLLGFFGLFRVPFVVTRCRKTAKIHEARGPVFPVFPRGGTSLHASPVFPPLLHQLGADSKLHWSGTEWSKLYIYI